MRTRMMKTMPARRAFTLLEMLLVVAILALLAALVGGRLVGAFGGAQVKQTRAQISTLSGHVERFYLDMSRYPTVEEGLRALVEKPQNDSDNRWKGPYLDRETLPKDAWGNEFVYQDDAKWKYRIVSYGADGKPGGEDENADLDNRS